ncbi:MAG TPA: LysR family transcriptional regulator [Kofleriaceae bacterium]|nr:LysR family transcriptional regulator [Kofleriaceae bacterium]
MSFPELPFLPTFVAIYELGGATAAAAQLHRTQPTLSYQLAQLERALGAPLFVRQGRQLVPTALANQLHRLAVGFARDLDVVRRGGEVSSLDVASVSAFGRFVLFPMIRRLDSVRVVLRFPTADEVFRRVADGEVDVGFAHRAVSRPSLILEPVHTEHLVLVAGSTWARRLATPKLFRDVPIVTYDESDYVIGRWIGHHFGRRAPTWYSAAHFEEIEEVLALVRDGVGVAVVPSAAVIPAMRLRVVTWGRPPVENTIFSVRRLGAPSHHAVDELIARLRE